MEKQKKQMLMDLRGCLGILNKITMKILLHIYDMNKSSDDPSAMIHVLGDPTKYNAKKALCDEYASVEF
ncbi:MAG: hypothetical protein K6E51_10395 [Treponema sp.]|nr:hypothetical protein [Treponema sp.]